VVIRGRRIDRSRVNCSVMEGSDEYTDRFRLTAVKMEELLRMGGPFLHRKTNRVGVVFTVRSSDGMCSWSSDYCLL
jgi:hypothetical protein